MKMKQRVSMLALCATPLACSAGYDGAGTEESVGTVSQAVLASECSEEAAAFGMTSDVHDGCVAPQLWQFPIQYEKIPDGTPAQNNERARLLAAMQSWTDATNGYVTFQELPPNSTVTPRVRFAGPSVEGWCQSAIGKSLDANGVQVVNALCGDDWTKQHELGHMLGFLHTQQRADRDRYLDVRQAQFCSSSLPLSTTKAQFADSVSHCSTNVSPVAQGVIGPFNTDSIMIYGGGPVAPATGPCSTADTSGCSVVKRIGNGYLAGGSNVSAGDGSALIELYRTAAGWTTLQPIVRSDPGSTSRLDTRPTSTTTFSGSPALARWGTSDMIAVARANNSHIYAKTNALADESWPTGSWTDLGGDLSSDPAAVSWASNRLDVVAVGTDGNVYHKWYLDTWGPSWASLGKPTASTPSAPAIASWGPDRLDVFVQAGNHLYQKSWTGSAWTSWTDRGTWIKGKPAAVSWGPDRIDVAAVGSDDQVWLLSYASGWGSWQPVGGAVLSGTSPAIASGGVDKLNIYVTGQNGRLWHLSWAGAWSAFMDLGGMPLASPGAFTQSSGRAHVAVRINNGSHDGMWHRYWN